MAASAYRNNRILVAVLVSLPAHKFVVASNDIMFKLRPHFLEWCVEGQPDRLRHKSLEDLRIRTGLSVSRMVLCLWGRWHYLLLNNSNDTFILLSYPSLLSSFTVRGHVIFLHAKHEKKVHCRSSDVLIPVVLIDGTQSKGTPRTGTSQPDKKPQGCSDSRYGDDGCVHLAIMRDTKQFRSSSCLRAPHCIRTRERTGSSSAFTDTVFTIGFCTTGHLERAKFFSCLRRKDWIWSPPWLLSNGYWRVVKRSTRQGDHSSPPN
jgi:hypothetical protein